MEYLGIWIRCNDCGFCLRPTLTQVITRWDQRYLQVFAVITGIRRATLPLHTSLHTTTPTRLSARTTHHIYWLLSTYRGGTKTHRRQNTTSSSRRRMKKTCRSRNISGSASCRTNSQRHWRQAASSGGTQANRTNYSHDFEGGEWQDVQLSVLCRQTLVLGDVWTAGGDTGRA